MFLWLSDHRPLTEPVSVPCGAANWTGWEGTVACTQGFWAGMGSIQGKAWSKRLRRMGLGGMKETVLLYVPKEQHDTVSPALLEVAPVQRYHGIVSWDHRMRLGSSQQWVIHSGKLLLITGVPVGETWEADQSYIGPIKFLHAANDHFAAFHVFQRWPKVLLLSQCLFFLSPFWGCQQRIKTFKRTEEEKRKRREY